jgi:hypothetical protein
VIFAAVGMAVMFTAHAAPAQSSQAYDLVAPGMPQPGIPQTVVHHSTAYCSQSTLNGVAFMQLIRAIVAHGDLTNIAFIENTLDTKFSSGYGRNEDGSPDTHTSYYNTDDVFSNPIHVEVDTWSKAMQNKMGIADVDFQSHPFPDSDSNFISDCLHITQSNFSAFFGGRFTDMPGGIGLGSKEAIEEQVSFGKNGTRLYLVYYSDPKGKRVNGVKIIEQP